MSCKLYPLQLLINLVCITIVLQHILILQVLICLLLHALSHCNLLFLFAWQLGICCGTAL
jgi:hypothetical protein